MSFRDCLIVERPNEWFLVVGTQTERLARDVPIEELVTCIHLMVKLAKLKAPSCLIAPASTSCFFALIPNDSDLDTRDRSVLRYEMESHVPLDAESMVADFVIVRDAQRSTGSDEGKNSTAKKVTPDRDASNSVSAVAIELAGWRELAEALEESGLPVRSIVPSTVLATRLVCRDRDLPDRSELLFVDGDRCDAVTVAADAMIAWKHLTFEPLTIRRHRRLSGTTISRVLVAGVDQSRLDPVREIYDGIDAERIDRPLESLWMDGASLALGKPSPRWFELRRDALGPSDPLRPILPQLRLVAFAATLFLLALAVGGWWRSHQAEKAMEQLNAQQRAAFQAAFPNTPVPAALRRRIRSEHTKLMASRGATSEVEVPQSATEVLRELLAALPTSVRFRVKSLKIQGGQVDLDLQVRTTVDAGTLANALESNGFEVQPPVTTRKDAKTFDSVLEARWKGRSLPSAPSQSRQAARLRHADSPNVEARSASLPSDEREASR